MKKYIPLTLSLLLLTIAPVWAEDSTVEDGGAASEKLRASNSDKSTVEGGDASVLPVKPGTPESGTTPDSDITPDSGKTTDRTTGGTLRTPDPLPDLWLRNNNIPTTEVLKREAELKKETELKNESSTETPGAQTP